MNFDDILGKLMPLLEKKLNFMMSMSEREMSLKEKTESNKTDLEYRKLEAQITTDKDKLAWEKEKLTTTIKGGYDLEQAKTSGMLDLERLKNLGAKDRVEIDAASKERIAKMGADTAEANKYLNTLGVVLGHAVEKSGTDAQGNQYYQRPTAEVGNVARSLMEKTGLAEPAANPQAQGRNITGEAENANMLLTQYKKAGNTADATKFLQSLDPEVRTAALARYQQGNTATPVAPVAAAIPPAAPVQPAGTVSPARPELQVVDRHLRPNPLGGQPVSGAPIEGAQVAERGPLTTDLTLPSAAGGRAFGILNTPAQVAQANDPARAAAIQKQADADEEARKRRVAIRQARGLTSIGF